MEARKIRGIVKMQGWRRGELLWEIERENIITAEGYEPLGAWLGTMSKKEIRQLLAARMSDSQLRGSVYATARMRGRLLWARAKENLIVTAGLTPIASLVGGTTANQPISVIGFGAGTAPPVVTDTDITPPAYYKAIGSVSFPTAGQAQFSWSLVGATDAGAVGLTITELAFYANTGAVSMPVARPSGAAPSLTMYAHLQWPSFTVLSGGTYTGTWTFVA